MLRNSLITDVFVQSKYFNISQPFDHDYNRSKPIHIFCNAYLCYMVIGGGMGGLE